MIVSEIMTTRLVTVGPDDTLSHAANLLRQYQFHHLPVVRSLKTANLPAESLRTGQPVLLFEGLLTSQDITMQVALAKQGTSSDALHSPWQERRVADVMHRASMRVTPTTSLAAAAQILVERGLNCLPVVEYEASEQESYPILVGLLTRSDLLMALARSLGAFEPGMQIAVPLPVGDMTPLAQTLLLAAEMHVQVRSIVAAPMQGSVPQQAIVRLGTINPAPLLVRMQEARIAYTFADAPLEDITHA